MMQSPKNRKGKKLGFSAPVAAMFLIAAVLGMQFGCTDTTTAPAEPTQTGIEKAVYGAISGVVHDLYMNQPLRGVSVTLQGIRQKYTATTDRNGQFRINNIYLGTVSGLSGGAGDGWSSDSTPQRAEFDFPLFFQTKNYAPWKEHVALGYEYIVDNGTIVIPSGTFFEVGRTGLMPYVQSFTGKVYAGPGRTPAKGVTVMLDHRDWPGGTSDWPWCLGNCPDCDDNGCEAYPDYVELVNSFAVTDDEGVFTFDLNDRVVAYNNYELIVYPYDVPVLDSPAGCVASCEGSEDPACVECECFACVGNGQYEFDSTEQSLNLQPKSYSGSHYDLTGYKLDDNGNPIVVQTADYAINLKDAEDDLEVIYCSLQATGNGMLPVNYNDFTINVTFNRPLTAWNFQILKDRSYPIAVSVQPTSAANISFDITPIERLNVAGNTWRFQIAGVEDYMGRVGPSECYDTGGGSSCRWDFKVAGGVEPLVPIAPWVDVNTGGAPTYQATAPDRRVIYRLYKDFGPTSPNSVLGVMQSGGDSLPTLNLAFNKPISPVGVDASGNSYYAYVRDRANTAWVQLPLSGVFDDGQQVEGQIYLPDNFLQPAGGDNNYLGEGNEIDISILPVNEDGLIIPAQLDGLTPGSYLALRDQWGPMIVDDNRSIYGYSNGTISADGNTLYDETANIAFHEVLDGSVSPVVTTASANFSVQGAYMDEKHIFVTAEFQPTVTATLAAPALAGTNVLVVNSVAGFYPGDELALYKDGTLAVKTEGSGGPYSDITLDGYDQTTNILLLSRNLSADHAVGVVVAMLGPMQEGIEAGDWTRQLNRSTLATAVYIAVAPDAIGNLPQTGSLLIVNDAEIVPVTNGNVLPITIGSPLLAAYAAGTSARSAMPGFGDEADCLDADDVDAVANTVLLVSGAGGDTSIMVEDGSDIAVGDWLQVGADDYVQVDSVAAGTGTEATITFAAGQSLHQSYAARLTTVMELTVVTDSVTMLAYPMIDVGNAIDLLPGAAVTVIDPSDPQNVYASTALSVYRQWIGLDDVAPVTCEPLCEVKDFPINSSVIAPANIRAEDSIQVNVTDTSGNTSLATDKDGDGQADFDELELWSGGMVK